MTSVFIYLIYFILTSINGFVALEDASKTKTLHSKHTGNDDSGKPLFLTPLIEKNKIAEALSLSEVSSLNGNVSSHSGFLTVNKKVKTNLFFWFIKANTGNWEKSPLLLYLEGGPGMTSLYALFCLNGPFKISRDPSNNFTLEKRQHAWTDDFNVLYIDSPAGTGYSHTNSHRGYSKNEDHIANNLYKALLQFFKLFHNLQKNNFYITGESYAGKYIPTFGKKIHTKNNKSKIKINLTGMFIGNAFISPRDQLVYGDYLQMIGLIDESQRGIFNARQAEIENLIANRQWLNATDKFSELLFSKLNPYPSLYRNFTGLETHWNYIYEFSKEEALNLFKFITQPTIRKTIHVGATVWGDSKTVLNYLREDIMKSVKPQLQKVLEHYDVLFYNGQLDVICSYPGLTNFLKNLKWSGDKEYLKAERVKWYVEGKLAGYQKKAGRLIEVMIRNSGHMVALDSPLWVLNLLKEFVSRKKE